MSEDFPFKIETLMEQCGESKDIAQMILDEFLIQVAADTKELETCVTEGNTAQVGKVGHRLKGTAGVLGADKLHALCFAIEMAGKEGNSEKMIEVYPQLKTEAARCTAAVPEARSRLK